MRALLLFLALGAFAFAPETVFAAQCNESCLDATDCSDGLCPVCTGSCISCWYLGDQTSCQDAATGASTECYWLGTECTDIGHVPEVPDAARPLLLLLLALIAVYFSYRVRSKPGMES